MFKPEVGMLVHRILGGVVEMPMIIKTVDETSFTVVPQEKPDFEDHWTFDIATGAEIDEDLKWGPKYGITGSIIKEIIEAEKAARAAALGDD